MDAWVKCQHPDCFIKPDYIDSSGLGHLKSTMIMQSLIFDIG